MRRPTSTMSGPRNHGCSSRVSTRSRRPSCHSTGPRAPWPAPRWASRGSRGPGPRPRRPHPRRSGRGRAPRRSRPAARPRPPRPRRNAGGRRTPRRGKRSKRAAVAISGRLEHAVGVAERAAVEHGLAQPQVGGTEPRRRTDPAPAVVERAVLRPLRLGRVVVGATEDALLPLPAVPAGMGGEPAVAGARLELGAVHAVPGDPLQHGEVGDLAFGVEVEGDPQRPVQRWAGRRAGQVLERPCRPAAQVAAHTPMVPSVCGRLPAC